MKNILTVLILLFICALSSAQESPLVGEWHGYYEEYWGYGDGTDNGRWKEVKLVIQIMQFESVFDIRMKTVDEENGEANRHWDHFAEVKQTGEHELVAKWNDYSDNDTTKHFEFTFSYNGLYILVSGRIITTYADGRVMPYCLGDDGLWRGFYGIKLYKDEKW